MQKTSSSILRFPPKNEVGDLAKYRSTLFYWKYQCNLLVKNLAGLQFEVFWNALSINLCLQTALQEKFSLDTALKKYNKKLPEQSILYYEFEKWFAICARVDNVADAFIWLAWVTYLQRWQGWCVWVVGVLAWVAWVAWVAW